MDDKEPDVQSKVLIAQMERLLSATLDEKKETQVFVNQVITYYESILASMPGNVYWMDVNGVAIGCNKNVLEMLGLKSIDQFKGLTFEEMGAIGKWSKQATQSFKKDTLEVFRTGIPKLNIEEPPIRHHNGKLIHFLSHRVPIINHGRILGVVGISVDITELKKTQAELIKAKEQAEAANKAKTEFIANMSHDIRTPLTGVVGLSELLEQSLVNEDDKNKAHMLHDSGEELLHMLNDILDNIKADRLSEKDINNESFDLHQCIYDLIRLETPATTIKHLVLKAEIAPNVPRYICSDRNKIHRILLNLVGNAIKFTQSGSITLSIECLNQDDAKAHLKFGVADTGIGIPPEVQSEVFNRFFKVSSSYKGIYTGHGLGLHIVKNYITLLGGHITLTSNVGDGTAFHFDLECCLGERPSLKQTEISDPLPLAQESLTKNYHILLVEDNFIALKTLEMMLSQKGHTFISAKSAEEALKILETISVDLIITDIGLPGISGVKLTKIVRNNELASNKKKIPIIGLTGHGKETWDKCVRAGMNEVLSKPIQSGMLEKCIRKILNTVNEGDFTNQPEKNSPLETDFPSTEEALFDLEAFPLFDEQNALEHVPDKKLLQKLINTFLSDELQKDIAQMQVERQQNHWDKVEKLSHKMKSGMSYLGIQRLFYACQYLERYYKAGHHTLLEPLYQQLLEVNKQTINTLILWLKK